MLLGFPIVGNSKQFGFHVNGADILVAFPANFNTSGWNHYAITFTDTSVNLYINGQLINTTVDNTAIAAATCTFNYIAKSNYADPSL